MSSRVLRAIQLMRAFGPRWIGYRAAYALRLKTGQFERKFPMGSWESLPLAAWLNDPSFSEPEAYLRYRCHIAPRFFFRLQDRDVFADRLRLWDVNSYSAPVQQAEDIKRGLMLFFGHAPVAVGNPPNWHVNPFTQQVAPAVHWSRIDDFANGDVKLIWEPSRFGFVFTLVRAYWRTGDENYAEQFWRLVEDWRAKNPPNCGVNWKCGQETTFRVMAWCFGLHGFLGAAATTPDRVVTLAQMIAVSGRRIEGNLDYALSQRNNHGISESAGLWTIGLLFPEFQDAARWRELGRWWLEKQAAELIYDDGAFSQQSVNYQRVMLHVYLWAIRLGDLLGQSLSDSLKQRMFNSACFLYQMQDDSGRLPNYGANDGALILPLSNCDYQDFRPVVQAAHYLMMGERCYPDGPWDEDLLWLFGQDALRAPVRSPSRTNLKADVSGYYTLRAKDGFVFVRCGAFKDRPGHADLLHADVWWKGHNIALDAGTYSYNAPDPWNNTLAATYFHNTVTVDGMDQMDGVGRFLWLPWARGTVLHAESQRWAGEHDGYQRLSAPVTYHREIEMADKDHWIITDRLASDSLHTYRLHWLLCDVPHEWDDALQKLVLKTSAGPYAVNVSCDQSKADCTLVHADTDSPRGWHSVYYNERAPALSLECMAQAEVVTFRTEFKPLEY